MLNLINISKQYQHAQAQRQTSHTVETGRLTVLIGPSGCGKSTLLKIIMGLEYPDGGDIEWEGTLSGAGPVLERRRKIGYVIQEGGLFPHLTARKNVTLVAEFLGWMEDKIRDRIRELCDLVQLQPELLNKYPVQLSGGQRQRISLMRALMLDPGLLLLDEPLGALDPMVRADLQQDLKAIFQKLGKTVLLVTHDMGEAAYFADHIVLMRRGKIVQQGRVEELVNNPVDPFVTSFIRAQRNPLDKLMGD